ncbi:MAG: asparagine synthase [Microbacteriaceae bacterium]
MAKLSRSEASNAFVFEGIHIAESAVRMALKNKILVESIGEGHDFDPSAFLDEARSVMLGLAQEANDGAARVAEQRKSAWGLHTKSRGTHDYRDRDTGNLRRRGREYKRVAKELERRAADEGELLRLIEQSREAAWEDVAANIASTLKLVAQRPDLDDDYEQMREARMEALRHVDLSDLAAQQKKRAKAVRKAARKAGV